MANHKVYSAIVRVIKNGHIKEPFSQDDFRRACPNLGEGTYKAILHKHRKGNPDGASELFELISSVKFCVLRPFRYDL